MSSLRYIRRLSTAAAASVSPIPKSLSLSQAKSKLRSQHDPDEALKIYNSISSHYTSPLSSRYAQDITVKRLTKSKRFSEIETLLESQKSDPKISEEPFLSTLIRSYGNAGMFQQALNTYNEMDGFKTPRSCISFNALLTACNKCRQFDQVPLLFNQLSNKYGFLPDRISYGILVKSYCDSGEPGKGLEILRTMEEKEVEVTAVTYTTVYDSLCKKGKVEEGETLWDEMRKKDILDVTAYNVRIMHKHGGEVDGVKGVIEEMGNVGLKPDTISYNYLMTCYCKAGMMDEAKEVYEDLEVNGCKPNAATFRTLIYYMCRAGEFEEGYKVFKESVQVHKIPDFGTLKYLVEGLVRKKRFLDAKGLLRTVKKKFPESFMNAWKKLELELGLVSKKVDATSPVAGDVPKAT